MAVIFRDEFDGSGSVSGRTTMGFTWSASGSESMSGGFVSFSAGSCEVDLGSALATAAQIDVIVSATVMSWQGLTITLAQNAGSSATDIGTGFRYDFQGQYSGDTVLSACGDVTTITGPGAGLDETVMRIRIAPSSPQMEVYIGGALVHTAVTGDSSPFGTLSGMKLRLDGVYDSFVGFVEVSTPSALDDGETFLDTFGGDSTLNGHISDSGQTWLATGNEYQVLGGRMLRDTSEGSSANVVIPAMEGDFYIDVVFDIDTTFADRKGNLIFRAKRPSGGGSDYISYELQFDGTSGATDPLMLVVWDNAETATNSATYALPSASPATPLRLQRVGNVVSIVFDGHTLDAAGATPFVFERLEVRINDLGFSPNVDLKIDRIEIGVESEPVAGPFWTVFVGSREIL